MRYTSVFFQHASAQSPGGDEGEFVNNVMWRSGISLTTELGSEGQPVSAVLKAENGRTDEGVKGKEGSEDQKSRVLPWNPSPTPRPATGPMNSPSEDTNVNN